MYWWVELPFTVITTEWKSGLKEDMKFNKLKYKILHLGQEVIHEKVKQWCTGLWSSLPKEILGIPVYSRLKIGQNYDYHSLAILARIYQQVKVRVSLSYMAVIKVCLKHCVQF